MQYRIFLITLFLFLTNCSIDNISKKKINISLEKKFTNKGFSLIYDEELFKNKIVNKKLDNRSLSIFHNTLKKNSTVKVTNISNNKIVLAKVSATTNYPIFFNSVISKRIANEIELDINEPYIEISLVSNSSSFIAKKAKTFDEEKNVADKAPVDGIKISNLNTKKLKFKKNKVKKFSYFIDIVDFYYYSSALELVKKIKNQTNKEKPKINKLSKTKYRVFLGPFNDIKTLQESFNNIYNLGFENLQVIKK